MYYRVPREPTREHLQLARLAGRTAAIIVERKRTDVARAWRAAIVGSSDDAIVGKTLEGVVTSWNPGAERLYGYTAAEMPRFIGP